MPHVGRRDPLRAANAVRRTERKDEILNCAWLQPFHFRAPRRIISPHSSIHDGGLCGGTGPVR